MLPNCPVCNTNLNMSHVHDASSHAGGMTPDGKYCFSYTDQFTCSRCGGTIFYHEEQVDDKTCMLKIDYRQPDYKPMHREVEW